MRIVNKLKTRSGMALGILVLFSLVLGLSYGTFIFSTGNYRSTSMLISDLLYGIDITTTGGNETINAKTVTLPSGKTSTILLKITSLNDVESKYGVSYKINSGTGSVKYSSNTGWLPTGKINKNGTGTYEKVVKIVIEATSDLSVDFNVDGGYTYNDLNSTKDGYTRVTEMYEGITDYTESLKTIIENETSNNIYGGDAINNYLQYPEDTDTTKNIWRIIGYYESVDGIKIIANPVKEASTTSNLRPVIYLQSDVKVKGSGTITNPYKLSEKGDVVFASATLNGTSISFPKESDPYIPKTVTCTNGSVGEWNTEKQKIILTTVNLPTSCVVDFTEGYTVTLNVINGSTSPVSKVVGRDGVTSFTVTPNDGYKLELESDTCNGTLSDNTYTISNITGNKTCSITFKLNLPTLLSQILKDNPTRSTRSNNNNGTNNFAAPLTATTTGTLFTGTESITGITDSPKEVYYYAGNTTNNWVKFAGFYWRIIRTNHDSSIRLLYVGTSPDTTSGNIGEGNFNSSYNSPKYVGYKYGEDTSLDTIRNNTTDSKIKTYVDNWYKNNLINYTKYLSTSAVYCNDRSLGTGQTYSTNSLFEFASYYRMDYNTNGAKANPSYNCTDRRDAFSVDNTSAKLTYPVSLMTTDEMAFAGGVAYIKTNTSYAWFISNSAGSQVSSSWWSLSPDGWNGARSCVWRWDSDNAYLNIVDVGIDDAVRPVLSLKSCIKYSTGNGSSETPYEIVETSSGC